MTIASTKSASYVVWSWDHLEDLIPDNSPVVGYSAGTLAAEQYGCHR